MDKLQAMHTFVRVVEAGSFSAVAKEQGSTQSAISKQVAALERELGAKLLARTTRSLALTDEGARYFETARRLVAEIAEAEAVLGTGRQALKGTLRVAASVGFGRLRLMPVVQSFLAANPDVQIDMRLSDGFIDLVERGIDVAVRIGELPDSSFVARRVGHSVREVLAHRRYLRGLPKGMKPPAHPLDLAEHNCIVYTGTGMRRSWHFVAGVGANEPVGTEHKVPVSGTLQTDSSEVVRAAILGGMGVCYTPTWLFEEEIARGDVVKLLPDWSILSPIHLVSPQERRHSAKVQAFMDHVTSAFAAT
ncbi:LysR family transcriptional regulator [Luteibacter aegosomaticola]|uniref:LysR family transcriptional regulator n=1 Tax=Luteibacter aegosomaticola TaxID=2911538 RepID=UPI001FF748AF|nr:LysR family transcriptional regulator [Luteibacter aegosomaticola]UPG92123.1 LysR family transcriptional regulator [Luteibacter aegosomaticola]